MFQDHLQAAAVPLGWLDVLLHIITPPESSSCTPLAFPKGLNLPVWVHHIHFVVWYKNMLALDRLEMITRIKLFQVSEAQRSSECNHVLVSVHDQIQ